jgi:hypothetical protein
MIPLVEKECVIIPKKDEVYKRDKRDDPETDERLVDNEIIDGKYVTIIIKTDTFERILRRKKYPGESVNQILNKIFDIVILNKKVIKALEQITLLKKDHGLIEIPENSTEKISEAGKKIVEKELVITKIIEYEIGKLQHKMTTKDAISKIDRLGKDLEKIIKTKNDKKVNKKVQINE